jgi:phosphoesterase RecJ-like protein
LDIYQSIIGEFERVHGVTIVIHKNPDGDAIGSALALALLLEGMDRRVDIYCWDTVPQIYRFLPGWEKIQMIKGEGEMVLNPVLVGLDSSDLGRLPFLHKKPPVKSINIDHHPTNTHWGDINLVEPEASATGEIIFHLLQRWRVQISPEVATCLYAAIFTDTGGFSFNNTTAASLKCGWQLVELGASPYFVSSHVYENYSLERIRLLACVLGTLNVGAGGRLAWVVVTKEMMERTGTDSEDTEDFINFPKSIKGVEVAVLFRERNEGVKVSFRSKGSVDVAQIALSFGGGGHKAASGCDLDVGLEEAQEQVISFVEKVLSGPVLCGVCNE